MAGPGFFGQRGPEHSDTERLMQTGERLAFGVSFSRLNVCRQDLYRLADVGVSRREYYDERHRRLVSHRNRVPAAILDIGYQGRATDLRLLEARISSLARQSISLVGE